MRKASAGSDVGKFDCGKATDSSSSLLFNRAVTIDIHFWKICSSRLGRQQYGLATRLDARRGRTANADSVKPELKLRQESAAADCFTMQLRGEVMIVMQSHGERDECFGSCVASPSSTF